MFNTKLLNTVSPKLQLPADSKHNHNCKLMLWEDRSKFHKDLHKQPLDEPTHFYVFSLHY